MYGRKYGGRELRFEPSGGLIHAALVMRDRETGSYWPIMTARAESGSLKGTPLQEQPVSAKMPWGEWKRLHPDTGVLSVDGVEHVDSSPYDRYFASDSGYRNAIAKDKRLATKEPVWAFELAGRRFAVPFRTFEGGRAFSLAGQWIFLYRPKGASVYASTQAWISAARFRQVDGAWIHESSGGHLNTARGAFVGAPPGDPRALPGLDTFWYVWSLTHPDTEVVDARP